MAMKIAIFGSSGTIGAAITRRYQYHYPECEIHTFSRQQDQSNRLHHTIDYTDELSIKTAAEISFQNIPFDIIFVATGHYLPLLPRDRRGVFAALSARVGSISDNQLGGWYAYRASKAALNMILKNAAIEAARRYKLSVVVGLHPGTVDSSLSKPFQGNVREGKLFGPEYAADHLIRVIDNLTPDQSGKCFAWDGSEIPA
ncbi:MAG: short-chain dehydrogenase [Rhodobacteraceae bacterium]|nr:short-chain dehydrogenase [Paracoccaceae bacterium]